eukprot:gene3869-97_t
MVFANSARDRFEGRTRDRRQQLIERQVEREKDRLWDLVVHQRDMYERRLTDRSASLLTHGQALREEERHVARHNRESRNHEAQRDALEAELEWYMQRNRDLDTMRENEERAAAAQLEAVSSKALPFRSRSASANPARSVRRVQGPDASATGRPVSVARSPVMINTYRSATDDPTLTAYRSELAHLQRSRETLAQERMALEEDINAANISNPSLSLSRTCLGRHRVVSVQRQHSPAVLRYSQSPSRLVAGL